MPLAVYLSLETNPEEAIVLALVLIAISFAVLVGLRDRWFGRSDRPYVGGGVTLSARRRSCGSARSTSRSSSRSRPASSLALLGPNGAGKSTLLRCLAGLLPIDAGAS